jgi:molecular chaperone GrpE
MSEKNNTAKLADEEVHYSKSDTSDLNNANSENDINTTDNENAKLSDIELLTKQLEETKAQLEKEKTEYLFLMAEFDNFRKRTLKEKSEIIRNGAESAMKGILPIVDDFERGLGALKDSDDAVAIKEGMELIYNKFIKYLQQNGVNEMNTSDVDFNPDFHEAIAMIPTDDATQKGKIIDTVSKGYTINDKVLRHAKVAVGQ